MEEMSVREVVLASILRRIDRVRNELGWSDGENDVYTGALHSIMLQKFETPEEFSNVAKTMKSEAEFSYVNGTAGDNSLLVYDALVWTTKLADRLEGR